jgi:hypothetical protein
VIAAGIYSYVGWRLSRRIIASSDAKLAWISFAVWWHGLAITTLIGALQNLLGALGATELPLFITTTYINILVVCVALWGLVYYLIYLFTGNRQLLLPSILFYAIYYVMLVYYVTASVPSHINIEPWRATLAYDAPLTGPFFTLAIILLLLPQIVGGFAYFTLYFRISEVTQKYRVFLISWSIIIWFLSPFFALIGNVSQRDWWQLASRFIGLVSSLTILMAYLPPRWLKRRYGILSLDDEKQRA